MLGSFTEGGVLGNVDSQLVVTGSTLFKDMVKRAFIKFGQPPSHELSFEVELELFNS